jgi:hypothetical protein
MSENVQRMCLLESFTSSTCGTCYAGNANLKNVLAQADENKWANIRYQMNWPGNGDPYYTDEGGVRRTLYGVTGVPDLLIDGPTTELNPASFQLSLLNSLAAKPAYAKIFAYASVVGQTVDATFTVTPVITIPVSNRKFFAAVVEKQTVKNVGGNGEKEFLYVMKKFLTSTSGNSLNNFVAGTPQSFDLSYTFNGNYRLPANGLTANIINHAIEHSVEDFGDLMVVCWIQDMSTGEVLQAFKTDAYLNVPPVMITSAEQAIHQTNDSKVLVQLKNKNTTNAAVTSYKVEYKVGNNATQTFLRDGINLPALADDLLDLPLLEIPLAEKTNLTATITEYNGVVIDDPSIVSIELFKDLAQSDKMDMLLKLWQDRYGQATTWKLFDLENKEVAKGGPYTELTSDVIRLRETQLLVPANGVYRFEIYDSQGDGINNGHGNGHYQISASDVDNPILTGDGKFGAKAVHYINVDDKGGAIASKIAATAPYVYASTLYLPQQTAGTLSIYNAQGKAVILNRNLGSGAISLGSLPSGVYIIKVDSATGSSILKAIL